MGWTGEKRSLLPIVESRVAVSLQSKRVQKIWKDVYKRQVYRHPPGKRSPVRAFYAVSLRGAGRMETQRNADDGISAESVNEKAKQGGQGEEKLSSCFCCGGDTGKSGSIRPLLIADADQIIQTRCV